MTHHFLNDLRTGLHRQNDRSAVVHLNVTYTRADVDRLATNAASLLRSHGMEKGDRVVLLTSSKLPFLIAHLGILYGGGISVPLHPRFTREEMRYFLTDSEAQLIIAGAEQREMVQSLLPELAGTREVLPDETVAAAPAASRENIETSADDACLMIYSSGTTGWPKGVVHTNGTVAAGLRAITECWRMTPDDIVVNVLPLFHIHGLSIAAHLTLVSGGCLHLEDSFDPVRTLDAVDRGTVFMAVPTMYYRFLEQRAFAEKARTWNNVRLFTCGSAPIRPEVLPRLEEILGKPVINRYGMTEAHVLSSLPLDGPWPAGSVGPALPGVELRIAGPNGNPMAIGEVGAVLVRGPNLFQEYWRKPEATRAAFASGWFDTGDLGSLDERGFLTLAGRSNDLIITNGYNVYPPVVERAINACPGVRESAVVGVPDSTRGERVVAFVVRDEPALNDERIMAFCRERLIDYQRPRQVLFVDELPRNTLGKVLRTTLVQWAEGTY